WRWWRSLVSVALSWRRCCYPRRPGGSCNRWRTWKNGSLRLPNKVMVVVGGSRGIGAAVARLAAERGWTVMLTYTCRADDAATVVRDIEAAGGKAQALRCDVSCEEIGRAHV